MKKVLLVLVFFIFSFSKSKSDEAVINVGFKFSYQFGNNSGFVWGIEASNIYRYNVPNVQNNELGELNAWLVCLEFRKGDPLLHIGDEIGYSFYGFDAGPSILLKDDKLQFCITGNAFAGAFIIPFVGFHYFPFEKYTSFQAGSFLKLPTNFFRSKGISFGQTE
jgi:hypothetical protein